GATLSDVLPNALREASLRAAGLVIGNVELARDREGLNSIANTVCPIVLVGTEAWDPVRSSLRPAMIELAPLTQGARRELWERVASEAEVTLTDLDLDGLATLRLGPGQIAVAAQSAVPLALATGDELGERHLRAAALANGAGRLQRLSTHIVPRATFDDLVLPDDLMDELRAIPGWMLTRHKVRTEWGMDRGARRTQGINCLFAGPSGTGKTLAAEVVAHSLGVDLYVIDLSQIVDKYIGETEKNLDRVFSEAEGVNGVLLFDEADALFGKRTDVKSSHDRNANMEVAYLLQRMERYDGVAVLTTNLRNNIDDAFTRRLDVLCSFPEPDAGARRALWERHLPVGVPLSADVDFAFLAENLPVTGGVIRNITIAAAHAAAIEGTEIHMRHLVVAANREYRKHGRLFSSPALLAWMDRSAQALAR
ncbi:MAG TPA: ATP-binding protein, partial [Ilumatobacteraceae bacterium]